MMILDANGLIYCLGNGKELPADKLVVTEELRDEYETALIVNGHRPLKLIDVESLPDYDEAFYYKEYTKYLNIFPGVNVASMRSLTDVSVVALVSCLVNRFGLGQQLRLDLGDESEEKIRVITDDGDLIKQLAGDFVDQVEIVDPTSL